MRERIGEGENKRDSLIHSPQMAATARSASGLKSGAWNSIQSTHVGGKGASTWSSFCCLPRHVGKESNLKQSSQVSKSCFNGMQGLQSATQTLVGYNEIQNVVVIRR